MTNEKFLRQEGQGRSEVNYKKHLKRWLEQHETKLQKLIRTCVKLLLPSLIIAKQT